MSQPSAFAFRLALLPGRFYLLKFLIVVRRKQAVLALPPVLQWLNIGCVDKSP
ncbi:MAG: hypothetical protein RPG89_06365 [Microcystis panniformis WG22]|nr:hypothetical protein [Microcystis panniformis WG22]